MVCPPIFQGYTRALLFQNVFSDASLASILDSALGKVHSLTQTCDLVELSWADLRTHQTSEVSNQQTPSQPEWPNLGGPLGPQGSR